jgi:hypothetical protein
MVQTVTEDKNQKQDSRPCLTLYPILLLFGVLFGLLAGGPLMLGRVDVVFIERCPFLVILFLHFVKGFVSRNKRQKKNHLKFCFQRVSTQFRLFPRLYFKMKH